MTEENQMSEPPAQQPVAAAQTNSLAIVAFVLSLFGFISGLGFIAGIICGHISLSQIKRSHESGRGLAIAALVIGYVMVVLGIVLIALLIIALVILAATNGGTFDPNMMGGMHGPRWNS